MLLHFCLLGLTAAIPELRFKDAQHNVCDMKLANGALFSTCNIVTPSASLGDIEARLLAVEQIVSKDCVYHSEECTCSAACDDFCVCHDKIHVTQPAVGRLAKQCPKQGEARTIRGEKCPRASCNDYYAPGRQDGEFMINRDAPFPVDCVFKNHRGYLALSFKAVSGSFHGQDYIVAGGAGGENPWWKCQDDMGSLYNFITDDAHGGKSTRGVIAAKHVFGFEHTGHGRSGLPPAEKTDLEYYQPSTYKSYSPAQMKYIRSITTVLDDETPIVCMDADADHENAQSNHRGHEASIFAEDGSQMFCTPCASGNCGGQCKGYHNCENMHHGEKGATYQWYTSKAMVKADANDCTGYQGSLTGDYAKFIIPASAEIFSNTGGGASFGYKKEVFLTSTERRDCIWHATPCTCDAECESECTCYDNVIVEKAAGGGGYCPTKGKKRTFKGKSCPMASCNAWAKSGATADGQYMINKDAPFPVDCHFNTGKGWLALSFEAVEGSYKGQKWIVAGGANSQNPWWKCKDDMGSMYGFISDGNSGGETRNGRVAAKDVLAFEKGSGAPNQVTNLEYFQPSKPSNVYTAAQMTYIRSITSELAESTPMVCMDADADGHDAETDQRGHEAAIFAEDGSKFFCTPCHGGDCGGECQGQNDCANMNGEYGATYIWHTSKSVEVNGAKSNTCKGHLGSLTGDYAKYIIPTKAEIYSNTGGGASFGYKHKVFLTSTP